METLFAILGVVSWAFYAVAVIVVVRLFFILPKLDRFLTTDSNRLRRLREIDVALQQHLLTPEEYAAKRQEILKDL
jgi:hypothetical protein